MGLDPVGVRLDQRSTTLSVIALFVLIVLVLAGLTWTNYRFSVQNPGGNDFLPRWEGTRLYFENGWSPYSREASRSIQGGSMGTSRQGEDQVHLRLPILFVYRLCAVRFGRRL
jgi:hypothetical protein